MQAFEEDLFNIVREKIVQNNAGVKIDQFITHPLEEFTEQVNGVLQKKQEKIEILLENKDLMMQER